MRTAAISDAQTEIKAKQVPEAAAVDSPNVDVFGDMIHEGEEEEEQVEDDVEDWMYMSKFRVNLFHLN